MSIGSCRYCGRKNIYNVRRCNDCGDICCDSCAICGTRCVSCNSSDRGDLRNSERPKQSNLTEIEDSETEESSQNVNFGKVSFVLSCIAAFWFLPIVIFYWGFIATWYLIYKIFRLKWEPFSEGFWGGSGKIGVSLVASAILGVLIGLFFPPIGLLVGLILFLVGVFKSD
jgi:hypothetical protein